MMQHEIGRLFGIFYIGTYLAAILLGIGCYIWRDEMISVSYTHLTLPTIYSV